MQSELPPLSFRVDLAKKALFLQEQHILYTAYLANVFKVHSMPT